ncbi:alsin-like isoform X2 [Haliotis cracherodii]|uniref:alsin-like isoform X2 n=1 Tax=Haliotis cracherodii TaxID=6455 RepID=UPI0039EB3900
MDRRPIEENHDVKEGMVCIWQGYMGDLGIRTYPVFSTKKVKKVAVGGNHLLFLTADLEVYSCGQNGHGQLGHGDLDGEVTEPKVIKELSDKDVVDIECGKNHSAAVTASGQIYCWGQASHGQCAVSNTAKVTSPRQTIIIDESKCCEHGIPLAEGHVTVAMVSCGAEHTVALSTSGDVWVWGSGIQLGLGEVTQSDVPKRVEILREKTVLSVCCGDFHTLALVEKSEKDGVRRRKKGQEATEIQTQKYFPPLCKKCNKEIYTYTDTNDTCIIDSEHLCRESSEETCRSNTSSLVTGTDIGSSISSCTDIQSPEDAQNTGHTASQESIHSEKELDVSMDSRDTVVEASGHSCDALDELDHDLPEGGEAVGGRSRSAIKDDVRQERADSENREDVKVAKVSTLSLDGQPQTQAAEVEQITESISDVDAKASVESDSGKDTGKETCKGTDEEKKTGATNPVNRDEEVVWRRAISLEEERQREQDLSEEYTRLQRSKSYLDEREAREYLAKQFEDDKTEKDASPSQGFQIRSTIQNLIPYPSNMMESVKTMTSKALTNMQTIAENLPFVSGPNTDLGNVSADADTITGVAETEMSVQEKAMVTSNSSLEISSPGREEMQESSFIEMLNQDISFLSPDSANSTPVREQTPEEEEEVQANRKSKSVRTLWAKEDQLDKRLSQDSLKGSDSSVSVEAIPKVSLDTEVWSWGQNSKGQLGQGDQVNRTKPCCVKMFSSRCVLKLTAGANHSLALTSVAQVYSWGQNAYGQLGHNENEASPNRVKFMRGYYVWDIAAGDAHSLFLTDSSGMKPDVFYCGKQPSADVYATVNKTPVPNALSLLKKTGWLKSLSSRGNNCACLLSDPAVALPALYELAAIQRGFYYHLNRIKMDLLKPLSSHVFYTSLDVFPYKSTLQNLLASFYVLTRNVGEQIGEMTVMIREGLKLTEASQFKNYSEPINMTQRYSRFLADFIAVGGFEFCAKNGSAFFEKIQGKFLDLILEKKVDKSLWAPNFRKVMMFPLQRLKDFCRHLSKLTDSLQQDTVTHKLLKKSVLNWESLKMTTLNEIVIADQTKAFWEGCNQKLADTLRIPSRRLLRDSKNHPVSIPSAGRFSSHLLLLFNDIFVHAQYNLNQVLPLETVWVEVPPSESDSAQQVGIIVTSPEETVDLIAGSPAEKAEWVMALNSAINKVLSNQKSSSSGRRGSVDRLTPPLIRHAKYSFVKNGVFKDATYSGSWLNGKLHGYGELKWNDGKTYIGMFKQGLQHGHGVLTIPKGSTSTVCMEGEWKDGKLNGYGSTRYSNGDCYEGYFKDGQRFGHGTYRQGRHMSSNASIHIGEWLADKRHGYGVQDDILRGEKYMGIWNDDARHGKGIVVTLDGMYFEGTFSANKLTGFGLMLTEDNSCYEGQFAGITQLQGNGTLTLPTGDKLEGYFNGSWNEDLKFNGTFIKATSPPPVERRSSHLLGINSDVYGKLSVPAEHKWADIFRHCCSLLGYKGDGKSNSDKAWESVAVFLTTGRKHLKEMEKCSPHKLRHQSVSLESLETIPVHNTGNLTMENYHQIKEYLQKAFDTTFHPLGKLMENLVDVFRAAYIGVGAHPRLLHHAIQEVKSYVQRMYTVVRILFPDLPLNGGPILIFREMSSRDGLPRTTEEAQKYFQQPTREMEEESISEIMTAAGLLYPLLLPKIYPPLFDLYALYNDKDDEKYWERVLKLNRQGDMALMAYLGIEQKFWLIDEELFHDKGQKLSQLRDYCYASAVDTLQQLSTAFSPIDKLKVLEKTFLEITLTVQSSLSEEHMWCMDDLFPIFQFVVVRSKIRHLGAEIHMIDDLIEHHMEYGELGLMSTTLKACYFQIQNEKMPHH